MPTPGTASVTSYTTDDLLAQGGGLRQNDLTLTWTQKLAALIKVKNEQLVQYRLNGLKSQNIVFKVAE